MPLTAGVELTAALLNGEFHNLFTNYAGSAQVLTSQNTTSATYTDLATVGPQVTRTSTGTIALVIFSAMQYVSSETSYGSAVTVAVSGATTIAASDTYKLAATEGAIGEGAASCQFAFFTITPGSNTYTMKYRVGNAAVTGTFLNRRIVVIAP